jgi:hypothetical protein
LTEAMIFSSKHVFEKIGTSEIFEITVLI